MEPAGGGYWTARVEGVTPGALYFFTLDEELDRPDPASRLQPCGVHGASAVVHATSHQWEDVGWRGMDLADMVIYELHVGVFTPEGTFDAIIPRLDALKDVGINTIEIMPVSQFPGERNWGYDGVYPFAVQNSYGGHDGLKRLVDACHGRGMAVILDVVYNHLGPEGNYLRDFGPYFTDRYRTPWGEAVNLDGAHSDEVRRFFIENALFWFAEYHMDGLRLDALHALMDMSAVHFLRELSECVVALGVRLGRKLWLIGESDLNDARLIEPPAVGGFGLDAVWCDDFHHALHTLLTGEREGYYLDFNEPDHLVTALREGFVYSGGYSEYRRRRHGNSSADRPARQFVVFSQNHDQVGNRMVGERLTHLVEFEALKVAAALVLLSPYVPLLFMGEEYGERSPFLYFVDHSDPDLVEGVRRGRAREFASFTRRGAVPDPLAHDTFSRSRLCWERRTEGEHKVLLGYYAALISLRRNTPALAELKKENLSVGRWQDTKVFWMERRDSGGHSRVLCCFNLGHQDERLPLDEIGAASRWRNRLDSSDVTWGGPGSELPMATEHPGELPLKRLSVVVLEAA
jgi:maltooligosyltrehalose trehalohydrolase